MKPKRQNFCSVPGCAANSRRLSEDRKRSLFVVPKSPTQRKKWEENLQLRIGCLTTTSAICDAHFEPHHVVRDFIHIINSKEVRLPRERPKLAVGAVPVRVSAGPLLQGDTDRKQDNKHPTHSDRTNTATMDATEETCEPSTPQCEKRKRSSSAASLTESLPKYNKEYHAVNDGSLELDCGVHNDEDRRALRSLMTPSTSRWTAF
ncbi:hypothetical protein HPB49_011394 [Dermacentor silvarum]|uniref:Uncharacterized protein n=1 Tax=Dermacentor silvarum TaxID=543639 RepID=A0ACB8DZP4_DERSI|nr:hypothetical protein HPB49_011394 [Dermacentor silvarum]